MYRILTAYRGGTSSLIYARLFTKKSGYNGKAAVTLMSTDVERTTVSLSKTLEMWAHLTEVSVGVWLLWRQLGPISLAPIGITLVCFLVQTQVSKFMGPKQALLASLHHFKRLEGLKDIIDG
jgi:ATP-binding cassette, subfamily C (CFTR/MRP), member 1